MVFSGNRHVCPVANKFGTIVLWVAVWKFLWDGFDVMGEMEGSFREREKDTFSSFCMDSQFLAGISLRYIGVIKEIMKKLEGSYTIEATVIMAVVLFSMVTLLQAAYSQCRRVNGTMRMHGMIERLRYKESESDEVLSLDSQAYQIEVKRHKSHVEGLVLGDDWSLSIENQVFEPEEFMRMLTLIEE